MGELLTARKLVAELARRQVGEWGPEVVRHWINEEPACPIAQRGRPGQPHKYDADRVQQWLRERDARWGLNTGAGQADANEPTQPPPEQVGSGAGQAVAAQPSSSTPPSALLVSSAPNGNDVRELLAQAAAEAQYNPTIEAMLDVLRGRDPRNWKAAEDAYTTRVKRLETMGYLVNVDDMRACLDAQVQIFRAGVTALRNQLKVGLAGVDDQAGRDAVIDEEADLMLERVADAARAADAEGASDAA